MRAPSAGQVLGGKYRLVQPLGKGGLAAVWRAEHLTLHSPVALKVIDPISGEDEDALSRFMREARAAAALRSPHVVQILDYGVDSDVPFIVMELLEGESLERRLLSRERLPAAEVARIVKHIARAIGRAHDAGVVHRDLKPANIFIVPNDDEEIIKVLDFGVAKATTTALGTSVQVGPTPVGALLGTPHYMSPEQAQGVRTLDHRTDLWSMGIVAYECLLGTVPFTGHSLGNVLSAICAKPLPVPSSIGPVPPGFDSWFARACAREPADRFSSAKHMADELARLCQGAAPLRARPAASRRSELGIASVQLPGPRRAASARPLVPVKPLVDDEASTGFLASLVRYKLQLMVAAVVAFAASATLIESQKRRQQPVLVAGATATRAVSPSPPAAETTTLPEPFSGLGRRVGPVPESTKVVLSAPAPPAPPARVPPLAASAKPAAFADKGLPDAVPASTTTATTANASATAEMRRPPARPAAIKTTPERAGSGDDTSCDPPYLVDAAGIRRVKARCL